MCCDCGAVVMDVSVSYREGSTVTSLCVCVSVCAHVCVWGGGTHMCMGRNVCVGGGTRTCVWMCALHACVCGMGWGCTHMCTCVCAIQHVCMCSLNTGCTPDYINFVIIVISCALKLKFAIHVLMLD